MAHPPGRAGLPLVGETLSLLSDPTGFSRERFAAHGPVFQTNVLGKPTAFLVGPEACAIWNDERKIIREGSFPSTVRALFGGRSLPMIDGDEHRRRKRRMAQAFDGPALEGYLPVLATVVDRWFERVTTGAEVRLVPALKDLALEAICEAVFGLTPGPDLDGFKHDYAELFAALTALPINVPGTTYRRGLKAVERLKGRFAALIQRPPSGPSVGLSYLRGPDLEGVVVPDDALVLELHHVVLAGVIVWAEFAAIVVALHLHPQAAARLRAELPPGEPTGPELDALPALEQFVMEVKRWCPNVPFSFGKAASTFEFAGFTIPEGWLVMMSPTANNHFAGSFQDPERFDPDRFGPARAEHLRGPDVFSPQGPGDLTTSHKCLGIHFSTRLMQRFTLALVRDHVVMVPDQDLGMRWDTVPPEPKDGLRVVLRRA